jgi:hypothetical protein
MQMNGGRSPKDRRKILSPQSVVEMQAVQANCYTATNGGYGLGLAIDTYKGLRRVSHDGSISTFGSCLAMIPSAGVAVAIMLNRGPGFWDQMAKIVDDLLDQLLGLPAGPAPDPRTVKPDRSAWPRYIGAYLGRSTGLASIRAEHDRLILDWNETTIPLSAYRDNVYFGRKPGEEESISVGFVPEDTGSVRYLMLDGSPSERFELDRTFRPDPASWAAYAGRYVGAEKITVRLEGDRLWVYSEDAGAEMPCIALSNSRFACDEGLLEFQAPAGGGAPQLKFEGVFTLTRAT